VSTFTAKHLNESGFLSNTDFALINGNVGLNGNEAPQETPVELKRAIAAIMSGQGHTAAEDGTQVAAKNPGKWVGNSKDASIPTAGNSIGVA